jgi:tetratricopeptide (TPR) repeat protein
MASMATLNTLGSWLAVVASILFSVSAWAEDGTLVVHVMDIHARPVVGVSLRAGAGSSVARVDSFGQARIRLAPNTRPGDIVFLELVAPQGDLVFISPLSRWTAVPSFDEKPANFVEVILVKRGDRAMLENGDAIKAMASEIVQKASVKSSERQDALKEVALEYGRSPEEVDLAIRNWGKGTTDAFEKGLSELYARQYPQAEKDLRDSLREEEDVEKVAKIKVAERASLLGRALRAQGKYGEAIAAYKEAVEHSPGNGAYLFSLAFTLLDSNRPKEAEELGTEALALEEQQFTGSSSELAYSYYKAGTIYVNQGKYAQAEPYFRRAVSTLESGLGPESPQLIRPLDNLALLCSALENKSEYEALIKRAQHIQKLSLSPNDPENTYTSNKLAAFYLVEGRYLEAATIVEDSMTLLRRYYQENANRVLPQEFGELSVETLNTLVLERHLRGFANKDDESTLQEALMFQRALTGDNSVEVAQCHERLADLFREQGRYQEAEKEYRQALEIRKGQAIPAMINLQAKLAYDLSAQGRVSEADNEAKESVRTAEASASAVSSIFSAYNHLAELYSYEHKPADAEIALKQALSQPRAADGRLEPERIESLNRLAGIFIEQGRFSEASQQLEAMRAMVEKNGPSEAGVILEENLAVVSVKRKACAQATMLLEHAVTEAGNLEKNRQAVVDDVLEKMVPKDVECKNLQGAEADCKRAFKAAESSENIRKRFRVVMLGHLGDVYSLEGDFERAESTYSEGLTIAGQAQDVTREDIANLLANKAEMYIKWNRFPQARQSSIDALQIVDDALWKTDPRLERFVELRSRTCHLSAEGDICEPIEARMKRLAKE